MACLEANEGTRRNMMLSSKRNSQYQLNGYFLLHKGMLALNRAERQGIRIDVDLCKLHIQEMEYKIKKLIEKFGSTKFANDWNKHFGRKTNYESNDQLGVMLYDVYKLNPAKVTASGKRGSTDEKSLRELSMPELEDLLTIKEYRKIISTYLSAYVREQVDGFIHPFFHLHTVRTYRSSAEAPNLQNIPVRDEKAMQICRSVMFARKGHLLVEVDFSGAEVSAAAAYHRDPTMLKYLRDPKSDMHGDLAYQLFILDSFDPIIKKNGIKGVPELYRLRQAAKNSFVFPQFYGDYYKNCAKGLACTWGNLPSIGKWKAGDGVPLPGGISLADHFRQHKIKSLDDFTEHVKEVEDDFWNHRFKVYNQWRKDWYANYQQNGYIDMLTGFRCKGEMRRNEAINYPVQGVAFHWLLWTLIRMDELIQKEKLDSKVIGEVHDSMLLDVHPDELGYIITNIRRLACEELPKNFTWINVPINVEIKITDVDKPWSEMHPFKD